MKLYWSAFSPFARKVMIVAGEAGIADRIERRSVSVGFTDLNQEVMALNPLNQIPTLIGDDGAVYADSRVICEYLDTLHTGRRLFPAGDAARWQALNWQSTADGLMQISVIWRNERLRADVLRSRAHLEAYEAKARATLRALEAAATALGEAPFGIGHAAIACALGYLDLRFSDLHWRNDCPQLDRLQSGLAVRPSYAATTAWLEAALMPH